MNNKITLKYENKTLELLFLLKTGSKMYGTNLQKGEHPLLPEYESDNDYKGVFIYSIDDKINIFNTFNDTLPLKDKDKEITNKNKEEFKLLFPKNFINFESDDDITLFELEKFINLSLNSNPDMIDILFASEDSFIYISELGRKILDLKKLFLSQQIKKSFSSYAKQQLERLKNHNKWVVKYPKTKIVIDIILDAYLNNDVNEQWISYIFDSSLNTFINNIILEKNLNKLNTDNTKNLTWEEFVFKYVNDNDKISEEEINMYRKPLIINYCFAKNLKGERFDLIKNTIKNISNLNIENGNLSIKEYLTNFATFRNISETFYNIFDEHTDNKLKNNLGLFSLNGDIKVAPQINVGENFLFHLTIDKTNFVRDLKNIENLWEWKTNRNEKRGILEEKCGYDTKHAAHLFRLLKQSLKILNNYENYITKLTEEEVTDFKNILFGNLEYNYMIEEAEKLKTIVDEFKNTSLPEFIDENNQNIIKNNIFKLLQLHYLY